MFLRSQNQYSGIGRDLFQMSVLRYYGCRPVINPKISIATYFSNYMRMAKASETLWDGIEKESERKCHSSSPVNMSHTYLVLLHFLTVNLSPTASVVETLQRQVCPILPQRLQGLPAQEHVAEDRDPYRPTQTFLSRLRAPRCPEEHSSASARLPEEVARRYHRVPEGGENQPEEVHPPHSETTQSNPQARARVPGEYSPETLHPEKLFICFNSVIHADLFM